MVFAMILGKIADENLRKAVIIFRDDAIGTLLSRPVGFVIIVLILLTIAYGLRSSLTRKRSKTGAKPVPK